MIKKRIIRRIQKTFIVIMTCFAITMVLLLSLSKTSYLPIFSSHNVELTTPSIPALQKMDEQQASFILPPCVTFKLASTDPLLLKKLQEQGWPAYLQQDSIIIGPYLKSFQSQLNLTKISQITPIPVRIADISFLER